MKMEQTQFMHVLWSCGFSFITQVTSVPVALYKVLAPGHSVIINLPSDSNGKKKQLNAINIQVKKSGKNKDVSYSSGSRGVSGLADVPRSSLLIFWLPVSSTQCWHFTRTRGAEMHQLIDHEGQTPRSPARLLMKMSTEKLPWFPKGARGIHDHHHRPVLWSTVGVYIGHQRSAG